MTLVHAIALSGLNAATRRLEASASNIANMRSTGALPGVDGPAVYAPVDVQLIAHAEGGVSASLASSPRAALLAYDPRAPFANAHGMVAAPDVDMVQDIVGLAMASYSYAANLAVIRTADGMARSLLELKV
jgi:flagellar basal-body rod protein FlgC